MNIRDEFIAKLEGMDIEKDMIELLKHEAKKMDLPLIRQFLGRISEMELQTRAFMLDLHTIATAANER